MNRSLPLLTVVVLACSSQTHGGDTRGTLPAAMEGITAADVHDRIAFLASDALRGRDTPSAGLDTAAQWIARQMEEFGLQPGFGGAWEQRYPYPAEAIDPEETRLEVSAGATHAFEYGRDYFADVGRRDPVSAEAVVAGPGRGDGEVYRGRAVIVPLDGLPEAGRRGFRFSRETRRAASAIQEQAREAGASAVVFLLDPRTTAGEVRAMADAEETPRRSLGGTEADSALPVFFVTRSAADRIFRMAGLDGGPFTGVGVPARPIPLPGVTLRLVAPATRLDTARAPNVLGILPGSDPELRDTYVVLSAHMDHVGVGAPDESGDSIYNGADDDASGTAVMLEVAQAMASLPQPPRRSLLFLAVSGEEKGLLGSRWFAEHPPVPLASIVADINLDMVGRNAPDSIVVIGQEYSTLGETVQTVARRNRDVLGLTVSDDLWPEEGFFFRSDHFNFARHEIPALFFFAGTHEDYHGPGDEVDRIDTDKAARVGRLVFLLTHAIADAEAPPAWDDAGLREVRRLTAGR